LIILADGSKVTLYPGSEIRYTSDFNIFTREIHLKGEAYFEVASDKNKPFLVYANSVVTKVLGTSFLVKAKENETDVEVLVDRKSTRLNSSHVKISYAVFCLKKKRHHTAGTWSEEPNSWPGR